MSEIIGNEGLPAGVEFSAYGLVMPDDLSFDRWDRVGATIGEMRQRIGWYAGDWYLYGEANFGHKAQQAKTISEAARSAGWQLEPKTVQDYASVCSAFPADVRKGQFSTEIEKCAFADFRAVAALYRNADTRPDAVKLLERRGKGQINPSELRDEIKSLREDLAMEKMQPVDSRQEGTFYRVILADPPWSYFNQGLSGAAENHYPCMQTEKIKTYLSAQSISATEDAVLFLWAPNPLIIDALDVMHAWGFSYKTNICWRKIRPGNRIGVGFYVRGEHELLLIGTRGSCLPVDSMQPSVVDADVQNHSEKPAIFHRIIETMYPDGPRLELFARAEVAGWDRMGLVEKGETK